MINKEQYLANRAGAGLKTYRSLPNTVEGAEAMRRLYAEVHARECALIEVMFAPDISTDDFRVYVDRNIRQTGRMDSHLAATGSVLARVAPGTHIVVFRDRDPRQPNRRESNLLSVEIKPHQRMTLAACCLDGSLLLSYVATVPVPEDPRCDEFWTQ